MKRYIFSVLLILFFPLVQILAQDAPSFQANAPKVVSTGRQFQLIYTANGEIRDLQIPPFASYGLNLVMGPNYNTEMYVNMSGNQVQQTRSFTVSFFLVPTTEGTITFPAAACKVNGQAVKSNALTIKVEKGTAPVSQMPQATQAPQTERQEPPPPTEVNDQTLFLRVVPSKTKALKGEQIILTYKLYTQVQVPRYQVTKLPSNKGFWLEELDQAGQKAKQYEEYLNGQRYTVGEIRHVAIFPQESGTLKIDPLEMEVLANIEVQTQRGRGRNPFSDFFDDPFFDDFFNNTGFKSIQTIRKKLNSNSVQIQVDPLPVGADASFSGAVGAFDIKSSVDKEMLKANEALTYKVTVSGKGNLMHIEAPKINFSSEFEVYEPKASLNIQRLTSGISGSKTFEWILIPRSKGKYTIPATPYTYYDIDKKKYVTLNTQEYNINVEKGIGGSGTVVSNANKQNIEMQNKDIDYIKMYSTPWLKKGKAFFLSFGFWLTAILICVFSAVAIFMLLRMQQSSKDILSMRLKKAAKMAKKRLRKAEKFLQQNETDSFYEEMSQALWGYFCDKFGISKSKLSIEEVQESLSKKQISEAVILKAVDMLNTCEYARFAPGKSQEGMNDFYKLCIDTIVSIENELK